MEDDYRNNLVLAQEGALDQDIENSLINLLPPSMQEHLKRCQNSFLADLADHSVEKNIRHMQEYKLIRKIRQSFWLEYNRAQDANRKMQMTRVWQGITNNSSEFYNIMKKDHFAVYIFSRPIQFDVAQHELFELANERMLEILECGIKYQTKDGNEMINDRLAKVQLEIWKHLDERIQGGIIKKVSVQSEQKNLNVNVDAKNQQEVNQVMNIELAEIKRAEQLKDRLAELRAATKDIEAISTVITDDEEDDT